MARRKLVPQIAATTGRRSLEPTAHLSGAGILYLNVATAEMLGTPVKVTIEDDLELKAYYLQPSTPDDQGAYTLSGGGNTTYRIYLAAYAEEYVEARMVGKYLVTKEARAVVLRKPVAG